MSVSFHSLAKWFTAGANWHGTSGIPHRIEEHLVLCGVSLGVALIVSIPPGVILGHLHRGGTLAQTIANLGRAVPSLVILIIAVPIVGIGSKPADIALVALAIPPILINTYVGMVGVDPEVTDAARGVGMSGAEIVTSVELPLAMPLILAGVRTAAFQVVATATLAAVVASGGLGRYIVDGLAVRDFTEVVAGSLLVLALAVAVEVAIAALQRALVPVPLRRRTRSTAAATLTDQPLEATPDANQLPSAA